MFQNTVIGDPLLCSDTITYDTYFMLFPKVDTRSSHFGLMLESSNTTLKS